MPFKQGVETGLFGKWLKDYVINRSGCEGYVVFYDHGDPLSDKNVVAIKGIYGDKLNRYSMLTQVDVLVLNPKDDILYVVEVEERTSSPKKIIGDVFANLMCNCYTVTSQEKTRYCKITPETKLVIAGIIATQGSKEIQLEKVIMPRMGEFQSFSNGIYQRNVNLVFREDIEATIGALKVIMRQAFY